MTAPRDARPPRPGPSRRPPRSAPDRAATTDDPRVTHHRIRHVPALDGLRGVAVAGVLIYHGGYLKGGYLGVDLFFVLSGYLITSILLTEWRRDEGISLSNFWVRRARRLFPAMVAVLVAVAIFTHFEESKLQFNGIRWDGIATLFYVANWHAIFAGQSYWNSKLAESPLKHTWSLAIEEQFYVVWPLVVYALLKWRNSFRVVFRVTVGLAVASAGLMIVLAQTKAASQNSLYLGTHTRAAAILMGAALATWHIRFGHTRDDRSRTILEVVGMVSIFFLGYMWTTVGLLDNSLYLGGLALCGLAVTAVIASATHPDQIVVGKVLSWAPLSWLGMISYGMYLWSWPIDKLFTPEFTHLTGVSLLILQLVVSLGVAILSYHFIEQPIRRGALTGAQARVAVPAAACVAVIALFAGTLGGTSVKPPEAGVGGYALAANPAATKLLVVGDSVPELITEEGIKPLRNELGVSVVDRTLPGCLLLRADGLVRGIENNIRNEVKPCEDPWQESSPGHDVISEFQPQVVMLMVGQFPNDHVQLQGQYRQACDPVYQQVYEKRLTKAVRYLASGGAQVVLVTAPGSTVSWVVNGPGVTPNMNSRVDCLNSSLKKIAAQESNVSLVDFAPYICPSLTDCKNTIDGINLREDTIHYEGASAELVARWIIPRVLASAKAGG